MRWVNRGLARPVAAAAFVAGLTPNAVTALSASSSLAGLAGLLFLPRSIAAGVLVALLLALGFVLDSADGQLARLRGGGSGAGEWLDHVVDAARTCLVHLSVTVALLLSGASLAWAVVGLAFCTIAVTQFFSQMWSQIHQPFVKATLEWQTV
ncbi:MAG: CDP-alcohol phosphatidyltransferase family protein [Micropruina sp.]|nr:CDP-alcohol phosphatidyltransferase family protein [Micropruina sp.]